MKETILSKLPIFLEAEKVKNLLLATALVLLSLASVYPGSVLAVDSGSMNQVFSDDFNDNVRDSSVWTSFTVGTGTTVEETNERLEITFSSTSSDDPVLHVFGAGYTSVCRLMGDFDFQIDFQLLVWPFANGVRLGMVGPDTFATTTSVNSAVERVSFGDFSADFPGQFREVYLTHFNDGVQGLVPTGDLSGRLRLVRTSGTLTGYYFGTDNWIEIHTGPSTSGDFRIGLASWSHDYAFTNQFVGIALDNFVVNRGQPVCPQKVDDFDNNSVNPLVWTTARTGSGPVIDEVNGRLEISLPADSSDDPALHIFGASLASVCRLRGDFDVQLDFSLLLWPPSSGVRVGLTIQDPPAPAVERIGFGSTEAPGLPREAYLTHFADGVSGITSTNDLSGKLRLVRSGSTLTGYYFRSGTWVVIHSGPTVNIGGAHFGFSSWSHNAFFARTDTRVAFDNFVVNQGELICPQQLSVSKSFTDSDLNPLPLRSATPKVDALLANGRVRSTNPGQILAWVNVTNTRGASLRSLKLNETLPVDWSVTPPWTPGAGAIHVFFVFANGTRLEITDPSSITVSSAIPQTVSLSIADLTSTASGKALDAGEGVLLSVKLSYSLIGTNQSASSYPRNYTDTAGATGWTGTSFSGSQSSGTGSAFFVAFAKVVGDVDGNFRVDILDASALAYSYGTRPGDSRWTPNADFDNNGIIDILDASQLASYYGTSS